MKSADGGFRRIVLGLARGLRDVWLMIGVTIALFVLIEVGFRSQRLVRRYMADSSAESAPSTVPPNPFESNKWWKYYWADHQREEHVVWEPYVYLRNPTFAGNVVTVDSMGHRVTPLPATTAIRTLRVFFLGGSTTFGWYQRNEHTIPAEASRRLQEALGTTARVEPTNFGVPGRIFAQEVFELILQLKAGARPDVVVFYDGINDVMAAVQNGRAGIPQNESNRVEDFNRGRSLAVEELPGMANDRLWAKRVVKIIFGRLEFVRSIRAHAAPPPGAPVIATDSAAREMAAMYVSNARIVEALAKAYGFRAVYIWQPALLSTTKPLTKREKWLEGPAETQPELIRIRDLHRAVPRLIGDTVRPLLGSRFVDETNLFSGDSAEVYVDLFGHTYESANPLIVEALFPPLLAAARSALH